MLFGGKCTNLKYSSMTNYFCDKKSCIFFKKNVDFSFNIRGKLFIEIGLEISYSIHISHVSLTKINSRHIVDIADVVRAIC